MGRSLVLLAVIAVLAATACSSDVVAPSTRTVAGSYALVSVQGQPLPYSPDPNADVVVVYVDSAFYDLNTDATLKFAVFSRIIQLGPSPDTLTALNTDSGTYAVGPDGELRLFEDRSESTRIVTKLDGDTFTTESGTQGRWVFRKR